MPWYKNTKNGPLSLDTADGDAISVPGKGKFYVSRATSLSLRFRKKLEKKRIRFIKDDPRDQPQLPPQIQEAVVVPPAPEFEGTLAVSPETTHSASASDAPGNVSTADKLSASVAPVDAQHSKEVSDAEASGAAEPEPGEGVTTDDDERKPSRRYKKRKKKDSTSES